MFGDRHASPCHNECRRGRDIKGLRAVTAGAARIDDVWVWRPDPGGFLPHDTGAASDLRNGLPFAAQGDEKGGNLRWGGSALHDLPHGLRGFLLCQVLLLD